MIIFVERFVENTGVRWIEKLSKEKYRDAWEGIKYDGVCISGLSEDRNLVLDALVWIKERAQNQHRRILQEIAEIVFFEHLAEHSVFPLRRTVVLSSTNLNVEPQRVARILAASARYFHLCHSYGRYKMCKVKALSEFQTASE